MEEERDTKQKQENKEKRKAEQEAKKQNKKKAPAKRKMNDKENVNPRNAEQCIQINNAETSSEIIGTDTSDNSQIVNTDSTSGSRSRRSVAQNKFKELLKQVRDDLSGSDTSK